MQRTQWCGWVRSFVWAALIVDRVDDDDRIHESCQESPERSA
jgi:hypothetical protein